MSWSVSFANRDAFEKHEPTSGAILHDDFRDQYEAAHAAASALIASGAVGDPAGDYMVSLNGHANPDHVPCPGWANDCIGLSVNQVSPSADPARPDGVDA